MSNENKYSEIVTLRWVGQNITTDDLNNVKSDVRIMKFDALDMTRDDFIGYMEKFMCLCGYSLAAGQYLGIKSNSEEYDPS